MHHHELLTHWTVDPLIIGAILLSTACYLTGVFRLWVAAGRNHGVRTWQIGVFLLGQLTLVLALLSPLDALSDVLFAAHMTQHELLMVVAAPLIVIGRPLIPMLWTLPQPLRVRVGGVLVRDSVQTAWSFATHPVVVLVVHGLVLWGWHIPAAFDAALANPPLHAFQHLMFFVTAALFWWSVLHGRYGKVGYGVAVLFVFATAMHTSLLGAILALGHHVWYPGNSVGAPSWGLAPLDDQQLAGFIMWIPAGVVLALAALGFFAAWLGEAGRRAARRELRAR